MPDVLETTDTPQTDDAPSGDEQTPETATTTETAPATDATASADATTKPEEEEVNTVEDPKDSTETRSLKREAQGLRKRLRETEGRETGLKTQVGTLAARIETIDLESALSPEAFKTMGAKDPAVVKELILGEKSKLKFDHNGKVEGLDDVVKGIKERLPTLFYGVGSADGSTETTAETGDMNSWFRTKFLNN